MRRIVFSGEDVHNADDDDDADVVKMRRIVFSGEDDHNDDDEDEDCIDELGQDDDNCDEVIMMRIRIHNGFDA